MLLYWWITNKVIDFLLAVHGDLSISCIISRLRCVLDSWNDSGIFILVSLIVPVVRLEVSWYITYEPRRHVIEADYYQLAYNAERRRSGVLSAAEAWLQKVAAMRTFIRIDSHRLFEVIILNPVQSTVSYRRMLITNWVWVPKIIDFFFCFHFPQFPGFVRSKIQSMQNCRSTTSDRPTI